MTELIADMAFFEARYGGLSADDQVVVSELLEDASALIFDAAEGSDADWVTAPATNEAPRSVKRVCRDVAYRAWSNPDSLSQMSMSNVSFAYVREGVTDQVFLTSREARIVRQAAEASSGMRTVTLESPWSG